MLDPFAGRTLREQTVPERPPLSACSADLDPAINLCRIPKTEDAQDAWLEDVAAIQRDLKELAKYNSLFIVPAMVGFG
jgi:hypothetical protein